MIHILLLLLKIIGITLLSVLGLLLLIILVVLFVPIRYSLNVEADKSVEARACVSWLLHLLHAKAVYDGTFGIVIRVFGIPIKRIPAPEEKKPKKSKDKQKEKKRARGKKAEKALDRNDTEAEAGTESGVKTAAGETADANRTESETKTASGESACSGSDEAAVLSETVTSEEDKRTESDSASDTNEDDTESISLFQKFVKFIRAVRAFFSKILYTIQNICGKIEKVKELIGYYSEVLKSEEGQRTFALARRELGRLLKHIAPTKLRGSLTIGMGDPAATGQIIAIVSMFYPIYGNNVSITADFDEKCICGRMYLKGRIRIITLIRIAWRVYFNKDVKTFLHMLKREENEA